MKTLYMIGGTMGVGKTTVCQILKHELNRAVFLDGDWCWDADPFQVNDETKEMVVRNICFLLNSFIHCSAYENIVFGWVMHRQEIMDDVLSRLDLSACEVRAISLVCSPEALRERLEKDVRAGIRKQDVIDRSIERLPLYEEMKTLKIPVIVSTDAHAPDDLLRTEDAYEYLAFIGYPEILDTPF